MKITEFNDKIKIGDVVIILDGHGSKAKQRDTWQYIFGGFDKACRLCPDYPDCPGYVKLIRKDGIAFPDCYRSHAEGNIRLEIITPQFLPDNLFEL